MHAAAHSNIDELKVDIHTVKQLPPLHNDI